MNTPRCLLVILAGLSLPFSTLYAQGVFGSVRATTSASDWESRPPDSTANFPVTSLGGIPVSRIPGSAPWLEHPVSTAIDPIRLASTPDTTLRRLVITSSEKVNMAAPTMAAEENRDWERLRNVPAIPPLFIAPSSVDKKTGLTRTRMSSKFGIRQHPILGNLISHAGIDLPAPLGTLVYATADGVCQQIIDQPDGIGLAVYLLHNKGHQTLYGHLLSSRIKPGQAVVRGQVIGRVGLSGMTTGPHLHYGVRYHGQVVDPLPYCFLLSTPASVPHNR